MKSVVITAMVFVLVVGISFAYADPFDNLEKIIVTEDGEFEFGEIIEQRKYRISPIIKIQGFTTTGEMFFLFNNEFTDFVKVMLLDKTSHWQKAQLKDKIVEEVKPQNPVITKEKIELHFLTDQYERVYNKADYKFFVKTFDKSIYSGNDFGNFQGKISGAKVSAIIIDPNGVIKADFEGMVENGIYEGSVMVPENLWQRGWYTVDLVIEFEGKFYFEQLSFYVFGQPQPDSGGCPGGTTRDSTGACV